MRDSRWHWRMLWLFCAAGWFIAICYVVADIEGTGLNLF